MVGFLPDGQFLDVQPYWSSSVEIQPSNVEPYLFCIVGEWDIIQNKIVIEITGHIMQSVLEISNNPNGFHASQSEYALDEFSNTSTEIFGDIRSIQDEWLSLLGYPDSSYEVSQQYPFGDPEIRILPLIQNPQNDDVKVVSLVYFGNLEMYSRRIIDTISDLL